MDVPSNVITHCDVKMGGSSNVITHCAVIMSHEHKSSVHRGNLHNK